MQRRNTRLGQPFARLWQHDAARWAFYDCIIRSRNHLARGTCVLMPARRETIGFLLSLPSDWQAGKLNDKTWRGIIANNLPNGWRLNHTAWPKPRAPRGWEELATFVAVFVGPSWPCLIVFAGFHEHCFFRETCGIFIRNKQNKFVGSCVTQNVDPLCVWVQKAIALGTNIFLHEIAF